MSTPAKPDRYVVDRIGTPDPEGTEYFVLDLVHDFDCRAALAQLGNSYRRRNQDQKAQECFDALAASQSAHAAFVERRNELYKKQQKSRK